ncbi:tautomerase [Paenibacillus sp. J23TS9]|uniref:tautomerase family protein n=1 Tax=Paenibacillus sp. J23TS9 TaxID=2807193 RepID=UPI001B019203|nr:tautomerase family protein [Paenibacillus sp. J23TS9]GIP27223.1 tautomerase [Paenibacillus sp. J23TS9]
MAQVKVYGLKEFMKPKQTLLSEVIHSCIIDAFQYPVKKKFHRFFNLEREDFIYPEDRSDRYTIIEISIFEGRSVEAKKMLIKLLFERIYHEAQIDMNDLEITIFETPKHQWGIRGLPGDELQLNYNVNV